LPACSQCLKSGWICPKYGDVIERMFQHTDSRDFEQPVAHEVSKSEMRLINATHTPLISDGWSSGKIPDSNMTASSPKSPKECQVYLVTLSPKIIQPIHCRAIDYFLSTHIFQECGIPRGYYEYLYVFVNNAGNSQHLVSSLSGVALAAYAYAFQYPDLLHQARRYYGHALQPEETIKNSTLSSVLLLNTFNTLTGQTDQSLVPCLSHMVAAISILSLNFHTMITSRSFLPLLLQVIWGLLQTYMSYSARIPKELIRLRQYATSAIDTNDPGWKLSGILINVAKFRADVKEGILLESDSIVKIALNLDSELSLLADTMPAQWLFESVPLKEMSELVFGTCYHVYPDQWVAFVWNCLRASRLLLHQEIVSRLGDKLTISPLSFTDLDTLNYQASIKILHQMTSEICATVPQYSGYLKALYSKQSFAKIPSSSENITNGIPIIAGAYHVLWPLLNAGQCAESYRQRTWIVERSRYIGRMTGIQQAFVFADMIERGEKIW